MDHPVLAEVAWAAARASFPTLRFNFRGVGASQGERGGDADRLADAEAALRVLEENTGAASAAAASLGASAPTLLALQALHPGLPGLCFISPVAIAPSDLFRLAVPLMAIAGERDRSLADAALAAAISEAGGRMETIAGADSNFQRHLPDVGKAVVRWLIELRTG
jgi:alpha/beta superfamily hydrolase